MPCFLLPIVLLHYYDFFTATKIANMSNTVPLSSTTTGSTTLSERRALRSVSSPLTNGENPILASDRRNPRPLARGDSRVKSLIGRCFI